MRKVLLMIIVGFALVIGLQIFTKDSKIPISPIFNTDTTPSPTPRAGHLFQYKDENYRVQYFSAQAAKISLNSNFKDKLSARELKEQKKCNSLINGGFYSAEDTALGLLISNGYTESDYRTNALFNGIFGITYADEPFLATTYPRGSTKLAIQSGPILIKDQKAQTLQLKNDEQARRSVVGIAADDKIYFFSVYKEASEYGGPLLADLSELINQFAKEQDIAITGALNLDGGSASAFYTDGVNLQELSYIGSYFCITQ